MTKFNVGDKVEFIRNYGSYKIGDVVEVTGIWNDEKGVFFKGDKGNGNAYTQRLKSFTPKQTKNQRITDCEASIQLLTKDTQDLMERNTALEKEVSELKLIVHELRDRPQLTTVVNNIQEPSTIYGVEDIIEFEGAKYCKVNRVAREGDAVVFNKIPESGIARESVIKNKPYKVHESNGLYKKYINDEMSDRLHVYGGGVLEGTPETVDVYEFIEEKPLSPNQQRTQIIEDAKAFFEKSKVKLSPPHEGYGHVVNVSICDVEFITNEEKRTVVALLRWRFNQKIEAKGIAKCNPSDVFNEHIGKAIALGRALNIDVSNFEQAVQPTLAIGQVATIFDWNGHDGKETTITGVGKYKNQFLHSYYGGWLDDRNLKIINDTNAQYFGGVE